MKNGYFDFTSAVLRLFPEKTRAKMRMSIAVALEKKLSRDLPERQFQLSDEHIARCRLVANRQQLLGLLPAGGVAAELGVYRGDFASQILDICQPVQLFLVDPWKPDFQNARESVNSNEEFTRSRFSREIENGKVHIVKEESAVALEQFRDDFFDWVYIDSDHSYEYTKKELQLASRKVKKNGFICGHDYTKGTWYAWVRFGVVEAVNEFCLSYGYEFMYLTVEPSMYFSYALRKIQ